MVGHLSLSRDRHCNDLVASLRDILEANSLVDCMISAEGQYLKAHKLILSACSPYFLTLFREETDKYPIAIFKDIKFEYLKLIIHFVYCGEVQVLDTQLNAFLEVAKFLQIRGLNSTSKERSPERTFSESPGSTNILENESNTGRATNAIIIEDDDDDDDCEVIDLAGATEAEVQEIPCEDRAETPLMITDESTLSLASPAAQNFVRAANQEWHSRPVSPVSVTSITSVKTEQLIDCDDTSGRSRSCSESENLNEGMEGSELDQLPPANDESTLSLASPATQDFVRAADQECHSRSVSPASVVSITSLKTELIIDCDDMAGPSRACTETENLNERMEGSELDQLPPANGTQKLDNSRKRACSSKGRSVGKGKAAPASKKEVRAPAACPPSPPPEDSDEAAAPESKQRSPGRGWRRGLVSRQRQPPRQRFTCAVCNKGFEFRSSLKLHLRRHTGERPYSCPECQQSFAVSNTLKKHMVTHSTKRPYKCPRCDLLFALPSRLKSHLKVHTGVKPYKCNTCDYVTAYSSALIRHKRSHTGERPYKCPECNYAAVCSANLVTHRRTHERARRLQAEQADVLARAKALLAQTAAAAQSPTPGTSS